jgi:hypothetical protein
VVLPRPLVLTPALELRHNYYRDLDLELDLWIDLDGTATVLDRDEFEAEVAAERLQPEWAQAVNAACATVARAVADAIADSGPDLERDRELTHGLPAFILRA